MKYCKWLVVLLFFWSCDNQPQNDGTQTASTALPSIEEATTTNDNSNNTKPVINDSLIKFDNPNLSEEEKARIMDKISKKYLMGQFDPTKDERFQKIPNPYADKEMYMRKEALASFKKMHEAAKKDGIKFRIVSATRPFNAQKAIWEAKWSGKRKVDGKLLSPTVKDPKARAIKILRWSSMPSTSRHHWGTDIDINSVNPAYFESGQGLKEYEWLTAHASEYGFCQVYSPMGKDRPFGYQEEKWHWSYLPISQELTTEYAKQITDQDISGFLGSESAPLIEVVKKYVLGINPTCK
ncbi:MAG: M15 family metallopeptidase [Aureispira sp.]|nr:M15 family metallopeptidase [Aureispira sp.]